MMSSSLKSFQNKCQEIHLNHEKKSIQSSLKVKIAKMQPLLIYFIYFFFSFLRFTVFTVFQQQLSMRDLT